MGRWAASSAGTAQRPDPIRFDIPGHGDAPLEHEREMKRTVGRASVPLADPERPRETAVADNFPNGKPVTVIDTIVSVCGKVPRPSVVYVLTAKNIDYEWENLKQDFLPLILASVKKAPF